MSTEITTDPQPLAMQVVAAFEKNETAISDVTKYMELTVEKHGIGKVTAGRVAVKKLRVAIDHRRKELIETALETQRTVNAHAKVLTAIVTPVEEYLQSQEDAHEAAKLAIEQEKQRLRRQRLTDRIERLALAGAVATALAVVEAMTDEEFEDHLTCETMRVESEREQREVAAKAAAELELARLAEIERQAEELRIRTAELAAERKAMEAEREAMLHKQAIERRQIEEQQAEVARQHTEIRKAEQDREEARRKEEQAAAAVAREEALKPELEKAAAFCDAMDTWAELYLKKLGVSWADSALVSIEKACIEIRNNVRRLELK